MSSFDRFQQRNQKRMEAQQKLNAQFVFNGYPSTIISRTQIVDNQEQIEELSAAVVNLQEKDKAYIFTHIEDRLLSGSVWGAKGLHWLIAEELVTIKDVDWHKYLAYLCNINVEHVWGYFKGPEKTYVNIRNEDDASLESLQKPVLVLPENILGFNDKIVIKSRPWLVQEYDAISSPGLIYYSLRATTVSKEELIDHEGEDVFIIKAENNYTPIILTPTEEETSTSYTIGHNIDITVVTENGFFKYNKPIKIKSHKKDQVIFSIPFGVNDVEIQTKEGGVVVTETFTAK